MELLIWHDALGSDDEQATEDELLARVLYAYSLPDEGCRDEQAQPQSTAKVTAQLQALHFVQALVAFTRLLRGTAAHTQGPISATLSRRRFVVEEMEPHVYVALVRRMTEGTNGANGSGLSINGDPDSLRHAHEAVLRNVYELFTLFHGSISSQLMRLEPLVASHDPVANIEKEVRPDITTREPPFKNGMELLQRIQSLRKRIRKIRIHHEVNGSSAPTANSQSEYPSHPVVEDIVPLISELEQLTVSSPCVRITQRCRALFPTLLRKLDLRSLSAFHAMDGVSFFPMDQSTFLTQQSLMNSLEFELSDMGASAAFFFKGNRLGTTGFPPHSLHLLQQFLRLREQDGMSVNQDTTHTHDEESSEMQTNNEERNWLWMPGTYQDSYLPIWASKTSYAECAVVAHLSRHSRRASRSLHKQQSASSLSTLVSELTASSSGSGGRFTADKTSEKNAAATDAPTESLQLLRRTARFRTNAPCYRNRGFMSCAGYFLPSWELSPNTGNTDAVWAPTVFITTSGNAEKAIAGEAVSRRRAVAWHEGDLTVLLLLGSSSNSTDNGTDPAIPSPSMLERIEACFEKLQLDKFTNEVGMRYQRTASSSSKDKPGATLAPYVYLNSVNRAFKAPQIRRLIKVQGDDLFPRPMMLWPHYLPTASLAWLTDLNAALHDSASTDEELSVKTVSDGWVVARRCSITQRELYAFFDTKVAPVAELQHAWTALRDTHFGSIFF